MPTVARDLDGFNYYALAFAAPFASGVVGMVASGMWTDRSGALRPLFTSMAHVLARPRGVRHRAVDGGPRRRPGAPGTGQRRDGRGDLRRGRAHLSRRPATGDLRVVRCRLGASGPVRPGGRGLRRRHCGLALGLPRHGRARRHSGGPGRPLPALAADPGVPSSDLPRPAVVGAPRRGGRARARAPRLGERPHPAGRRRRLRAGHRGPATAAPGRRPRRTPRAARGHRDARPAQRGLLLRRGLHRLRPPGAVGPHARAGRHRADVRRSGLGQPPARCRRAWATRSPTSPQ